MWRNRDEHITGREEVRAFLQRKWAKELDYKLKKYRALPAPFRCSRHRPGGSYPSSTHTEPDDAALGRCGPPQQWGVV